MRVCGTVALKLFFIWKQCSSGSFKTCFIKIDPVVSRSSALLLARWGWFLCNRISLIVYFKIKISSNWSDNCYSQEAQGVQTPGTTKPSFSKIESWTGSMFFILSLNFFFSATRRANSEAPDNQIQEVADYETALDRAGMWR